MTGFLNHPGFLGLTSQGIIGIHAAWPMYPEEFGADLALSWLTAFPAGTTFRPIDDIDRCNLLLAEVKCSNRENLFDERNFHIAVWHDDLLRLKEQLFIEGVSPVTERKWEELRRTKLPSGPLYLKNEDGSLIEIVPAALDDYDNDNLSFPNFSQGGVVVTDAGRNEATCVLANLDDASLSDRVEKLFQLCFYDTAVREACVELEHRIKTYLGSSRWGDSLVEDFISSVSSRANLPESYIKVLRGQIRTVFKFIRNDFMHNFVDIDETQCRAQLFRVSRVKRAIEELMKS